MNTWTRLKKYIGASLTTSYLIGESKAARSTSRLTEVASPIDTPYPAILTSPISSLALGLSHLGGNVQETWKNRVLSS